MAFLALDAGNSSVKAAVWDGGWGEVVQWPSDDVPAERWAERLASLGPADHAGLASVVPTLTPPLAAAVRTASGADPVRVGPDRPLPFRLAYRTPHTLGADRLAAAVAAWHLGHGRAVVVVDAGSAITTEAVSAEPAYLGGAILPGPDLLRRALARDTGQLPEIDWPDEAPAIGGTTAEAIQAGLATLVVGGVERLLDRTVAALGSDPLVLATGGWAPWLAARVPCIDRVEPHLVLDGVRLLSVR